MLTLGRKGALQTGATVPAPCRVQSGTENPCPRRAAVEVRGVAFCGPCAREQEAYFAIGEIVAREETGDLRGGTLAETLKRARAERVGGDGEDATAETHHGPPGAYEVRRLAPRAS